MFKFKSIFRKVYSFVLVEDADSGKVIKQKIYVFIFLLFELRV